MTRLVYIRWRQLQRQLRALGLFYTLILFGVFFIAVFSIYSGFHNPGNAPYVSLLIIAAIFFIHQKRTDFNFIKKQIANPQRVIFSEYAVAAFPFAATSLFTSNWFYFPVIMLLLYAITFIRSQSVVKTRLPHLSRFISIENFEWVAGIRKNFYSLAALLVLSLAFSWVNILPLAFAFFISITCVSFYAECESLDILFSQFQNDSVGRFLFSKLARQSIFLIILITPAIIVNSIVNPDMIWFNTAFLLGQVFLLTLSILFKYSMFSPHTKLSANEVLLSVFALFSIAYYTIPVFLILIPVYYFRAIKNLNSFK